MKNTLKQFIHVIQKDMMNKFLFYLFSFIFYLSFSSQLIAERIKYTSYTPEGFVEIFSGDFKSNPVELSGELVLPKGEGPFPVVILQHGTADIKRHKKWMKNLKTSLLEKNIGVFINDSYKNRKIKGSDLTLAPRVIDGLFSLQAVANHPLVDNNRIGIQGYSYGGMVAFFTAYKGLADIVDAKYAAHMPVYPGCDVVINHMEMTGAPIKMIIAELDDYAPAQDCIDYGPKIGEIIIYKGLHHSFVFENLKFHDDIGHFRNCEIGYIQPDGNWYFNGKSRSGSEQDVLMEVWKECGDFGVHTGGKKADQERLIKDTVSFFSKNL